MSLVRVDTARHWLSLCILSDGAKPKPLPNLANALIALRHDEAVSTAVAFDEMEHAVMLMHPIGESTTLAPRPLRDVDVTDFQEWMQHAGLKNVSNETVRNAIDAHAMTCAFHPVRDYLGALAWD